MSQHAIANNEEDLNEILVGLGLVDELIEPVELVEQVEVEPTELEIESAVRALETQEVVEQHYASEPASGITMPEDAPAPEVKPEEKKGKGKKKAEPKAPKEPKAPRKIYASKAERVSDKLGAGLSGYTILTLSDGALTGDDLAAKQQETLAMFENGAEGIGTKVQNRMVWIMEFVAGKSVKLNEVIERAFRILKKDGFIKSGEKGNYHADLMTKYSLDSARAMGNNTLAALRNLKVVKKGEDGSYVANEESLVLMQVNGMLGL